ncbi:MAG TPA: metallophosphoesterase [Thermomicrobiales bacterium]|nr:metallophosphoesterase [Thermomicrobiales bacterium]
MSELRLQPVRIAAVGDLHIRTTAPDDLAEELSLLNGQIDLMVVAGDITDGGRVPEVEAAAEVLSVIHAPMIGVLGNHDRRGLRRTLMRKTLERGGLELLDGHADMLTLPDGRTIGFAGISGTGGGFRLDEDEAAIGGRIRQVVAVKARREAQRLKDALQELHDPQPDVTIAVTHFAPTVSTLGDEPVVKYWMLGNSLLGQVIDEDGRVDLAIHGHAHLGSRIGETPGGVPVRNVALPVTGGIVIFEVGPDREVRAINTVPGPHDDRNSETVRFRMLDLLRNE